MDERARRFASAAGAVGVLANLLLIGFYALELGREPVVGVSLGWLNDLTGAVGTALMVPVALAFGPAWLRALGITAMTVATVGGLLLVFGVLTFEQQLPIVLAAFVALALWMLLTARQLTGARRRLGVLGGRGRARRDAGRRARPAVPVDVVAAARALRCGCPRRAARLARDAGLVPAPRANDGGARGRGTALTSISRASVGGRRGDAFGSGP